MQVEDDLSPVRVFPPGCAALGDVSEGDETVEVTERPVEKLEARVQAKTIERECLPVRLAPQETWTERVKDIHEVSSG